VTLIAEKRESWRRPILGHPEETTQGLGFAQERRVNWILSGPHAEEDLLRIRLGTACEWCLQTFPAVPNLANIAAWRDVLSEWEPHTPREEIRRRVVFECCPTCAKPIRPEQVDHSLIEGEQGVTPIETAAASFYEERDARYKREDRHSAWIRGRKKNKGWKE
jgi:hypothetical protein